VTELRRPATPKPETAPQGSRPSATDHDPVNHPAHYTSHPSGVECIEIIEWFPANLANAWKYLHRQDLKGVTLQDLRKSRWYVERELRRRRILARRQVVVDVFVPVALPKLVARYLRHEDGRRREVFGQLWAAFLRPVGLDELKAAQDLLAGLVHSARLTETQERKP